MADGAGTAPRTGAAGEVSVTRRIARLALEALLAVLAIVLLGALLLIRGLPAAGRPALVVGGGSMEPTIQRGSVIILELIGSERLAVNDVVTMHVGSGAVVITHRIIRLVPRPDGLWIETKGDANAEPDPSIVPASVVQGRVVAAIPAIGYLVASLSETTGVVTAFGLAGFLVTLLFLLDAAPTPAEPARRPVRTRPRGLRQAER